MNMCEFICINYGIGMLQCFLLRNKLHTVNGGGAQMHIYTVVSNI